MNEREEKERERERVLERERERENLIINPLRLLIHYGGIDFVCIDLIPALEANAQVSNVSGLCPGRDRAFRPGSVVTPPAVSTNFTRRSYCILATLRENNGNSQNPVLYFFNGTTVVGNFSFVRGIITHSLRGVTARFSGNYSMNGFQQMTVCINAQTSEALLYIDCAATPTERVPFIQSAGGVLANSFTAIKSAIGGPQYQVQPSLSLPPSLPPTNSFSP